MYLWKEIPLEMGVADTHTSPLLLKEPGGWIQSSFSIFFCTQRYLRASRHLHGAGRSDTGPRINLSPSREASRGKAAYLGCLRDLASWTWPGRLHFDIVKAESTHLFWILTIRIMGRSKLFRDTYLFFYIHSNLFCLNYSFPCSSTRPNSTAQVKISLPMSLYFCPVCTFWIATHLVSR